jgi:uncharacterized protein YndB with AHSA1/START domain
MGVYRFSVSIAAPPELVFALWTDLDLMREWVGGVTKVTDVSGPVDRAGTTYTTWFGAAASHTEVLEADRPRLYHTRFGNRLLAGENRTVLEAEGNGTRLVEEFRVGGGLLSRVLGRIFSTGSYKGSFRGELQEFARIAEREAASRAARAGGS